MISGPGEAQRAMGGVWSWLKERARQAKRDGLALWLAARDARVPWLAKVLALIIGAYVLSPIDLIPDFIPVLGYLDEVILLPIAVGLVLRLLDPALVHELRQAAALLAERPRSTLGAALVVAVWIGLVALVWLGIGEGL